MKISKREQILLGLLGIVFITVLYWQFVFVPQSAKVSEIRAARDKKEKEYDDAMTMINNLQAKRLDIKVLNSKILDKSKGFYPTLLQEKIIVELDKYLVSSGLDGNISFSPIEVAPVEKFVIPEVTKAESSLKGAVDQYNGKENTQTPEANTGEVTNIKETDNKEQATTENGENAEGGDKQNSEATKTTTEQLKVAVTFAGSYEGLKAFLDLVEGGSRNIVVTDIAITPTAVTDISGTMNLEFYAVPKVGNEDMEYLKWTFDNTYGKDSPFSDGSASGAYNSTIEQLSENADVRDFAMMLRAPSSELPTLTIGKTKDSLRETYLYSDKNQVEEVEIQFVEENGKLYYKYRTSDSIYPKSETGTGKEFTAVSDKIVVEISSESRVGNNDKSGIKLKVINNTTKAVDVIIKNDDSTSPRASVLSEGNTVNVK